MLCHPDVILGIWRAAPASATDLAEDEVHLALEWLNPLRAELFPAERVRLSVRKRGGSKLVATLQAAM